MATSQYLSGGFIPSPPHSTTSTHKTTSLPDPRNKPLQPGGLKESTFIHYVDQQLLKIQRRFAKRTTPDMPGMDVERDAAAVWDNVKGYTSMREACKDVDSLVDMTWISGTPSLQIPYLLSIANLLTTIIPAMPPTPQDLFRLLEKLDHVFASLLQGRDVETGEALPGFNTGRRVSGTEKVRLRGLVMRTRRCVMQAFKSALLDIDSRAFKAVQLDQGFVESEDAAMDTDATEDDGNLVLEGDNDDEDDGPDWNMQIGRVYDRTMVELGESLEVPTIGIITE